MAEVKNRYVNTVPNVLRRQCLELFRKGYGYKRTATALGLNKYTVRDYMKRFINGDTSWAERGEASNERDKEPVQGTLF